MNKIKIETHIILQLEWISSEIKEHSRNTNLNL
jgi:hypothetical protein